MNEIRQLTNKDFEKLEEFFSDCNFSSDHRTDTFLMVKFLMRSDQFYRGFACIEDDLILSVCFMRELTEQKAQVLDFIATRKAINIFKNKVGQVVDYAIKFGEKIKIYRFYTFLTDDMLGTVDVLKKKNLIFTWRERYDTYLDEVIETNHFSKYFLHWAYVMNSTLRSHKKNIRHHHLKPEYIEKLCLK